MTELPFQVISDTTERVDCCIDAKGLIILKQNELLWNELIHLKTRGIRSRFVMEVTQQNTYFCNLMMQSGDVYHSDRINGSFIICDGIKYICYILNDQKEEGGGEGREKQVVMQLLYTTTKPFVDAQQYLFDNLCNKAVPAKEKIRELNKGIRGDFIDNIEDPKEIQKIAIDLVKSASYEILLLFSTINSFYRAEYAGMLNLLWEASGRGVTIKILIQTNDVAVSESIQKKIRQERLPINIQYIRKPLQTKITTLVIDQSVSLAIEINDDTKKTFEEAIGVAIYSNSESTVSSCLSIFETLWIQSEFDKQNKVRQAYFQMFKSLELKDELYTRRWAFERRKKETSVKNGSNDD